MFLFIIVGLLSLSIFVMCSIIMFGVIKDWFDLSVSKDVMGLFLDAFALLLLVFMSFMSFVVFISCVANLVI